MKHLKRFNEAVGETWEIYSGLGGGYGGANFIRLFSGSRNAAESLAYQEAVEIYESHVGNGGLRTEDEIMDEDGVDEEEARQIYNEEMEDWLDYYVKLYDGSKTEKELSESYQINENIDVMSLVKGRKYRLTPQFETKDGESYKISDVEVMGRGANGYLFKDDEKDFEYEITFDTLRKFKIEELVNVTI